MKRNIIIGLGVYTAVFLLSGVFIANTIRAATDDLDSLITLHRVEILREHYLLQIKKVQSDLILQGTEHSRPPGAFVTHVSAMGQRLDTCFGCHHSDDGTRRLEALRRQTDSYRQALDGLLATGSSAHDREVAFERGEALIAQVHDVVDLTTAHLEQHTRTAMVKIKRAKWALYALVALGPLLSGLLGVILVSGLTRPLGVLLASTRRLKAGDLDHRVVGLTHEFGELAVAFNEMASSLRDQMRHMERTQQLVVVGELAAGLAHEIKNPLAGIKVAVQVLSEEAGLGEEDRGVLRRVAQEVVRVESLMKNFLNFARPAKPQLTELDVSELVGSTLALYAKGQATARDARHPLRIEKELGKVPHTLADPMQLQQIVLNLVLNAVESMPSGGTLTVRTSYDERSSTIRVEVCDTGRGVAAEHVDRIFQPFFTTKPEGTGLGLAVSKRLVEQHGGSIRVAGNPAGGTVFHVELPLLVPPAAMTG